MTPPPCHRRRATLRALWLASAALVASACDHQEPASVRFAVRAEQARPGAAFAAPFMTDQGEEVHLLDLELSLGPVYVIEERSLYAQSAAARAWRWLLPLAHAGGNHDFAPTTVVGESLGQRVWSVRSGPAELAAGEGIESEAGSVDVELRASAPDSPLSGHAAALTFALVRGEARAVVRAAFDWEGRAQERTITSIPTDLVLREGGSLSLLLDPSHFFDGISFAALFDEEDALEGTENAPFALSAENAAPLATIYAALQRRLLSVGAWRVRFEGP